MNRNEIVFWEEIRRESVIHQYKNNGYNIVMDVASGSVHVVDDVVYDAVAILKKSQNDLEKPMNCGAGRWMN